MKPDRHTAEVFRIHCIGPHPLVEELRQLRAIESDQPDIKPWPRLLILFVSSLACWVLAGAMVVGAASLLLNW